MKKMVAIYGALAIGISAVASAESQKPEPVPPTSLDLRTTIEGSPINLADSLPTGRNTPGVLKFLQTGADPYIDDDSCLRLGQNLFLTACSGCHGQVGEGKIGPGLNKDYWTYPGDAHDAGMFGTMFAGARAMMGPHNEDLTLDQFLLVIAWVRHLYKDQVKDASWLSDEQKRHYKPYTQAEGKRVDALPASTPGQCQAAALQQQQQDQADPQQSK